MSMSPSYVTPGFKLVKVVDSPATWIEVPSNSSDEYIANRVEKFIKNMNIRKKMELGSVHRIFSKLHKTKYINYSGSIYHIDLVSQGIPLY